MIDLLFMYATLSIWLLLVMNIVLTYYGYEFYEKMEEKKINILTDMKKFPSVSIMIPAHNEGVVMKNTLRAMVNLNYPKEKLQIIVVNDNSIDDTSEIIESMILEYPLSRLLHVKVPKEMGGKGKSNALNIGYKYADGEHIVVYDADNTPNTLAIRYLVHEIESQSNYGAVVGKFRTRNKNRNLLTRFINIETLCFQAIAQAGRWQLFNLCTIPGTNFIIRRSILEDIGGWDPNAIAEDTELSFRIYQMGYKIALNPLAVTWEEEPENLKVWMKQRTRWASGNMYVLLKHTFQFWKERNFRVLFDLFYFFSVYFLFLSAVVISDVVFLLGVFTKMQISLSGNFFLLWVLGYLIFILQMTVALSSERGEGNYKNLLLTSIMYFTYSQLWIVAAFRGTYEFLKNNVFRKKTVWYKTERFG